MTNGSLAAFHWELVIGNWLLVIVFPATSLFVAKGPDHDYNHY
jgi:hypothetical protein